MPTANWAAAADALTLAARDQFGRFLVGPVAVQVYAVGLFFDPDAGDVYPVANTVEHHLREYGAYVKAGNPADELPFLWDSGRWEHPAGLFPSATPEYLAFDRAWGPFRNAIATSTDPDRSARFAETCVEALRRLAADGVFARATELLGYVVQSANDRPEELAANQERVTATVRGAKA